jgi:hypothetical protein
LYQDHEETNLIIGKHARNVKVAVPWRLLANNPGQFIDPEYLPKGVHLGEPSKMTDGEVRTLCGFLHRRQSLGKKVLRFRYIVPQHVRGRSTVLGSDEEESDAEPSPGGVKMPTPRQSSGPSKTTVRSGGHHVILSSECVLHFLFI